MGEPCAKSASTSKSLFNATGSFWHGVTIPGSWKFSAAGSSGPEVLIPRAQERFADGKLVDESTRQLIGRFGAAMVTHVRRYKI